MALMEVTSQGLLFRNKLNSVSCYLCSQYLVEGAAEFGVAVMQHVTNSPASRRTFRRQCGAPPA